ncbi:MAG TPA: hypothetical protein VEX43_12320 [Chthoniobacterales bacterium]|nr:hypothetical protein [Chthoniobacterales bacterium]
MKAPTEIDGKVPSISRWAISALWPGNPANRQTTNTRKKNTVANGIIDNTFTGLLYRCAFRKDYKSCSVLDVYVAVTRVHARLQDELKEFNIRWPVVGPDPAPDIVRDILGEGDPDGNPARYFPVAAGANIAGRIDVATKLHSALQKISGELEANINQLRAGPKG